MSVSICSRCRAKHSNIGRFCDKCKLSRPAGSPAAIKPTGRIYNSSAWKKIRKLKLSLNPLCELCSASGRITAAAMVDHVKEIKDGGKVYDLDNLQALCWPCHAAKTARARANRIRADKIGGAK